MMKYILIIVSLVLVALAGVAGYFYFTNPTSLYNAPQTYQSPVVIDDEEISEDSSGGIEVDTMEAEINSLDVPTDSGDISDEDLMGL